LTRELDKLENENPLLYKGFRIFCCHKQNNPLSDDLKEASKHPRIQKALVDLSVNFTMQEVSMSIAKLKTL
jgi:hypothetical protein